MGTWHLVFLVVLVFAFAANDVRGMKQMSSDGQMAFGDPEEPAPFAARDEEPEIPPQESNPWGVMDEEDKGFQEPEEEQLQIARNPPMEEWKLEHPRKHSVRSDPILDISGIYLPVYVEVRGSWRTNLVSGIYELMPETHLDQYPAYTRTSSDLFIGRPTIPDFLPHYNWMFVNNWPVRPEEYFAEVARIGPVLSFHRGFRIKAGAQQRLLAPLMSFTWYKKIKQREHQSCVGLPNIARPPHQGGQGQRRGPPGAQQGPPRGGPPRGRPPGGPPVQVMMSQHGPPMPPRFPPPDMGQGQFEMGAPPRMAEAPGVQSFLQADSLELDSLPKKKKKKKKAKKPKRKRAKSQPQVVADPGQPPPGAVPGAYPPPGGVGYPRPPPAGGYPGYPYPPPPQQPPGPPGYRAPMVLSSVAGSEQAEPKKRRGRSSQSSSDSSGFGSSSESNSPKKSSSSIDSEEGLYGSLENQARMSAAVANSEMHKFGDDGFQFQSPNNVEQLDMMNNYDSSAMLRWDEDALIDEARPGTFSRNGPKMLEPGCPWSQEPRGMPGVGGHKMGSCSPPLFGPKKRPQLDFYISGGAGNFQASLWTWEGFFLKRPYFGLRSPLKNLQMRGHMDSNPKVRYLWAEAQSRTAPTWYISREVGNKHPSQVYAVWLPPFGYSVSSDWPAEPRIELSSSFWHFVRNDVRPMLVNESLPLLGNVSFKITPLRPIGPVVKLTIPKFPELEGMYDMMGDYLGYPFFRQSELGKAGFVIYYGTIMGSSFEGWHIGAKLGMREGVKVISLQSVCRLPHEVLQWATWADDAWNIEHDVSLQYHDPFQALKRPEPDQQPNNFRLNIQG